MRQAAAELLEDKSQREEDYQRFADYWLAWSYGGGRHAVYAMLLIDPNWRGSVDALLSAGLPMEIIEECVDIAMGKAFLKPQNIFRYMRGVA